jgi:hypothetical protein
LSSYAIGRIETVTASTLTPEQELILEALRLEAPALAEINRRIIAIRGQLIPPQRAYLEQARDEGRSPSTEREGAPAVRAP